MIDPVCGMMLDPSFQADTATRTAGYDGATYYFCSDRCQRTIQAPPQVYAEKAAALIGERHQQRPTPTHPKP